MADVDLAAIEKTLNKDEKERDAFIKNPSTYLARKGLKVTPRAKAKLKDMVKNVATGPSVAARSAANARVDVEVSVTVRF